MTIKITQEAKVIVDDVRTHLEPEHGSRATEGASLEYLLRLATGTLPKGFRSPPTALPKRRRRARKRST